MGLSIKSIGKFLGKGAKIAAPFLPPGFREAAAFGGSVLDGGNIRDHAMNTAGATLGGMLGGRGVGKGIGGAIKGGGGIRGVGSALIGRGGGGGVGSSLMGGLRSVGKFALSNPDAILGGLSAVQGYQKGRQADRMMDRALNDPGLNPERPDLTSTFSGYSNPYSGQPNPFGEEARTPMMVDRSAPIRRIGRRYA